jgi:hypothetical protein
VQCEPLQIDAINPAQMSGPISPRFELSSELSIRKKRICRSATFRNAPECTR